MKAPPAPKLDKRRADEFAAELQERARAWIPEWGLADGERDFGRALLKIAARFNSEVAERLDKTGEKMRRGFLDWLAVRGEAARPSRMPVALKLADAAQEPVLAPAPVRMQVDADGTPVIFETEKDLQIVPGRLDVVVGVNADEDEFFLSPPGLSDLQPLEPTPTVWVLKSSASAGAMKLQLDPDSGLAPEMIVETAGGQYRIIKVDNEIVTIEPGLAAELPQSSLVRKVTTFTPFDGIAINRQEHALYLGHMELLNIEAAATIEIVGASTLRTGVIWQYWGKVDGKEEDDWQPFYPDDQSQKEVNDAIVLSKPKGVIEVKEINGKSSRWIRAFIKTLDGKDRPLLETNRLELRVNCERGPMPCPPNGTLEKSSPSAEAMANNTPLVLSEPFYPLGREPRQFDAFYLGCKEAFSKKGATAQVCFEMSDATCQAYALLKHGIYANKILAGVGKDRALHILNQKAGIITKFRGPLRPPRPAEPGVEPNQPNSLDLNLRCRPVIWNGGAKNPDDFYIAVAAGGQIWEWHENAGDQKQSGWKLHSIVPGLPNTPAEIEDIIVLGSSPDRPGAVLSGGRFWLFDDSNNTWFQPLQPPPKSPNRPLRDYAALAPIYDGNGAPTDSMVAVSATGKLYRLDKDATESLPAPEIKVDVVLPGSELPMGIRPAAIIDVEQLRVVAVSDGRQELVAVEYLAGDWSLPQRISLRVGTEVIGAEVTTANAAGKLQFSVGAKTAAGGAFVASWVPTFIDSNPTALFETTIPDASGTLGGTPLVVGDHIVVPGGRGDTFVAPFNPLQRLEFTSKFIVEGVILPAPAPFALNDFISVMTSNVTTPRMEWKVNKAPSANGSEFIYVVDPDLGESVAEDPQLIGYVAADSLTGEINSFMEFGLGAVDLAITPGMTLRISVGVQPPAFCEVESVDPSAGTFGMVVVKRTTQLPADTGALTYWKPKPSVARVVPAIEFQPAGDGNWSVSILDAAKLYFPVTPAMQALQPSSQRATAFGVIGDHPTVIALAQRWTSQPPPRNGATPFIIDGVIGIWRHDLSDTASNPALSWEYWNGKGWWSLGISDDGTEHLASTGAVKFGVPQDIAESDWSGKTNFWIRSRLIGGDYGREEVKVISKPGKALGETEQIVERSTENIRAPQVLDLHISYSICNELFPTFVLAKDSGTFRDQSEANRTAGAIVEAFVPLAVMLGRLSKAVTSTEQPADCPPECDCQNQQPQATVMSAVTAPASAATSTPTASGRFLFMGLTAAPSEAPVNVLLLVEERPHTAFAPMTIEALVADRFVPIVADDATWALGESGLLSMAFAIPPTRGELFGKTLTWLRLSPAGVDSTNWNPNLHGAYLNGVWASATETLTRELVGSSDGAPYLTLRLARPPVLRGTLELRVKEPLGEEERKALRKADEKIVLSDVQDLPGDWVLWKQVTDPNDEEVEARVYGFDESTGEIRFGDGLHGAIPPIGRDSIVAFSYQRTEPPKPGSDSVPGNLIAPRTALNLVSPVEGVESVFSADQAAGGAPPEPDDRVLRFGFARIRHRNRAVTAHDFEDLALQSSPDIVQAHAFVRRGYISLVVVMRGKNPQPNAAQIRELRRLLLNAAPVSLSERNALRIEGPKIRRLRIELTLQVETLDHAGALSKDVKKRLAAFFDTGSGGVERDGWTLGINPSEGDIAFLLTDTPHLESIVDLKLYEVTAGESERTWPADLRLTELAVLDNDPIRIEFKTAEVMV